MEGLPPRTPDEEPHGHEGERLWPGEIDLTGVVRQDDALGDVIGDAIAEAEGGEGEVPEWGARTMARALANERDDPLDGALHRFAVTGRAEPKALAHELSDLYERTQDPSIREWINWLGTYVIRMSDKQVPTEAPAPDDTPDLGRSAEEFTANVRQAFADADARGEPIAAKDARAVATLLAIFLDNGSQMASFADKGEANPVLLHQECQEVRRRTEHVPGLDVWIDHLEQHLASRSDLGRRSTRSPDADGPIQAERQSTKADTTNRLPDKPQEHSPAFQAFLTLPDIDHGRKDLLQFFTECYVGVYDSMEAVVTDLTEGVFDKAVADIWGTDGITPEDMVRAGWDIVELGGKLYVFNK